MRDPNDRPGRARSSRHDTAPAVPPGVLIGAVLLGLLLWGGIHYYSGSREGAIDRARQEAGGAIVALSIPIALALIGAPLLRRLRRRQERSLLDQIEVPPSADDDDKGVR